MTCRDFSLLISVELDGHLSAPEQTRLNAHLSACAACRREAAELRCLRAELGRLSSPATPALSSEIMTALQQEARAQAQAARRRADRLDAWRLRIFSQSVGTCVSFILFFFLTSQILKPIHRTLGLMQVVSDSVGYPSSEDEAAKLEALLKPPLPNATPRPIFSPSGALLGFSESFSEDEFVVAVKVDQHGHASVKQVVEPPRDPALIQRLSDALFEQASFRWPTVRRTRSLRPDAVLMFSKVNIPG